MSQHLETQAANLGHDTDERTSRKDLNGSQQKPKFIVRGYTFWKVIDFNVFLIRRHVPNSFCNLYLSVTQNIDRDMVISSFRNLAEQLIIPELFRAQQFTS